MRTRPPLYYKLKKNNMKERMLPQGISFLWIWTKETLMWALIVVCRQQRDLLFKSRFLLDPTRQRFTVCWNLSCENNGDFEIRRLISLDKGQTSMGIRCSCRSTGST